MIQIHPSLYVKFENLLAEYLVKQNKKFKK